MGSSSRSRAQEARVVDPLRSKCVAATGEEMVRQRLLHKMLHQLLFPKELIVVEKELGELPHLKNVHPLPRRRADILCFAKEIHPLHPFYPLLLIECKHEEIDQKAIAQLLGYNYYVKAPFVALASAQGELFGYRDKKSDSFRFLPLLPPYVELLALAHGK